MSKRVRGPAYGTKAHRLAVMRKQYSQKGWRRNYTKRMHKTLWRSKR